MVDVISLLKLLKELLPDEVYAKIAKLILKLMENEDRVAYAQLRKVLMDWVTKHYPDLEKLLKMILDKVRPAAAGETAEAVTVAGVAEAGAVVLSGPMAILGGLLLPATKWWGKPEIDLGGWWRNPCDEKFSKIAAAFAEHMQARGAFPKGFTSGSPAVMNLLSDAGYLITLCNDFAKTCPDSPRLKTVQYILQKMSGYQTEYYNF